MRKFALLVLVSLVATLPAAAQEVPAVETFAGYQYTRVNPGSGISGINLNGWNAAMQFNASSWLGLVADFSGAYGSPTVNVPPTGTVELSTNLHTFLFGPQIAARRYERVTPFARILFGGVRAGGSSSPFGRRPDISEAGFAMALGGGLDVKASEHVALRLVQADYLLTRLREQNGVRANQNNARISAGIVFRFGSR